MPLYEYQCQQCHRQIEKIQKFSDAPLTTCPHCSGTLERTITAPAVQFKGAGWYKDLYSSPKPPAAATSGEGSTAGSSDSAATSSDSKPAAPATSTPANAPAPAASSSSTGS